MDVTTTHMISLIETLRRDYPTLHFIEGDVYKWTPKTQTITVEHGCDDAQLLHELGHALLGHTSYVLDIHLLEMERDAWEKAQEISSRYQIMIDDRIIQTDLDSYREWLHARSTCPQCHASGLQIQSGQYHCLACLTDWRVNEARTCGLKRYQLTK